MDMEELVVCSSSHSFTCPRQTHAVERAGDDQKRDASGNGNTFVPCFKKRSSRFDKHASLPFHVSERKMWKELPFSGRGDLGSSEAPTGMLIRDRPPHKFSPRNRGSVESGVPAPAPPVFVCRPGKCGVPGRAYTFHDRTMSTLVSSKPSLREGCKGGAAPVLVPKVMQQEERRNSAKAGRWAS